MDAQTQPRIVVAGRYIPSMNAAVIEVAQDFGTVEEWQQLMADVVDYAPDTPPFADPYGVLYADDEPAIEDDYEWIRRGC